MPFGLAGFALAGSTAPARLIVIAAIEPTSTIGRVAKRPFDRELRSPAGRGAGSTVSGTVGTSPAKTERATRSASPDCSAFIAYPSYSRPRGGTARRKSVAHHQT